MGFEADAPDLIIEGKIPGDLAGIFYRNGPDPLHPPREGDYHWFDGDGMVFAFEIAEGRVSMRNRWVKTEKFLLEKAAGKRLFGVFGNPMTSDPSVQGKRYNTGNTNIILHGGYIFPSAVGIWIGFSPDNQITHNEIADLYYTGISAGWRWGYAESLAKRNTIAFNHVHHIGWGVLSDMGGIYTLGPQPGTIVRNNLFHDIRSHRYGGWALYTDEGSTGIVVEDNVVYRCTDAGFHQHYGRDNRVRNNLIVDNVNHSVMRTRSEAHRSFVFERNVVVGDGRKWLGSDWSGSTNQFLNRSNLWWDPAGLPESEVRFGKDTWEAWRARGQDAGSVIADPQLVGVAERGHRQRPGGGDGDARGGHPGARHPDRHLHPGAHRCEQLQRCHNRQ
jgi:parallel beta-helix repeat protein